MAPSSQLKSQQQHEPTASATSSISPREVYDLTGDSEAALNLLVENAMINSSRARGGGVTSPVNKKSSNTMFTTPQEEYNSIILSSLASEATLDTSILLDSLTNIQETISLNTKSTTASSRKRQRDEMIMTYNKGLILLTSGQVNDSIEEVWTILKPFVESKQQSTTASEDILRIACRLGFLLLECLLTIWPVKSIIRNNNLMMMENLILRRSYHGLLILSLPT